MRTQESRVFDSCWSHSGNLERYFEICFDRKAANTEHWFGEHFVIMSIMSLANKKKKKKWFDSRVNGAFLSLEITVYNLFKQANVFICWRRFSWYFKCYENKLYPYNLLFTSVDGWSLKINTYSFLDPNFFIRYLYIFFYLSYKS